MKLNRLFDSDVTHILSFNVLELVSKNYEKNTALKNSVKLLELKPKGIFL